MTQDKTSNIKIIHPVKGKNKTRNSFYSGIYPKKNRNYLRKNEIYKIQKVKIFFFQIRLFLLQTADVCYLIISVS